MITSLALPPFNTKTPFYYKPTAVELGYNVIEELILGEFCIVVYLVCPL
jgi:hypothetical protein